MDIQASAARELRRRGFDVERFQLGYTDFWDTWRRDETFERPVDVVHMGAENARRLGALADYAGTLWPLETRIFVPPEQPKTDERSDFLLGKSKWQQLRSAKTLLNIHRSQEPYFEWVRVLEAIINGCVVISEHSVDFEPLLPGEHFVAGGLPSLAFLADHLVRNEEQLATMRLSAYDFVRSELPMRPAAERLAAIAEGVARSRRRSRQPREPRPSRPRGPKRLSRVPEATRKALNDPRLDAWPTLC